MGPEATEHTNGVGVPQQSPPLPPFKLVPPPPGVIDPVQDAIAALTSIQALVAKAKAQGGSLINQDWTTLTQNYESLAGDVYALNQKAQQPPPAPTPAPPAASSGMSTGATIALSAGGGAVVGGLIGFAIGRASASPKEGK